MEKHLLPVFAVISGEPSPGNYSGAFRFVPADAPETESKGVLLVNLHLSSTEEIDLQLLGTQLVNCLHETYYQDANLAVVASLKQALASLPIKLKEILPALRAHNLTIQATVAVVWGQFLYLGRMEAGEVYLKRGNFLGPVNFNKVASGRLQNSDWLFLANDNFWKVLPPTELKLILDENNFETALKKIDAAVGKSEDIGCVLANFNIEEDLDENETLNLVDTALSGSGSEVLKYQAKILHWLKVTFRVLGVYILKGAHYFLVFLKQVLTYFRKKSQRQPGEIRGKPKKKWRLVLPLLIIIFTLGLLGNLYFRGQETKKVSAETLIKEALAKKDEAKNLQTLNTQRARELLIDAQNKLTEAKKSGSQDKQIVSLQSQITDLLSTLLREYRFAQLPLFYDLSLLKTGILISSVAFSGENILAVDKATGSLLLLDLKEKKGSTLVTDDRLKGATKIQVSASIIYISVGEQLVRFDSSKKDFLTAISLSSQLKDFSIYNSTLYFLTDQTLKKGQLTSEGVSNPTNYLTSSSVDLTNAKAVSVDGFVWVLTSNGVLKLSRGAREDFSITGLEKGLNAPLNVFSSESTNYLYLLDKANNRVVVIEKNGNYFSQYISPGFDEITSLIADEGKNRLYLAGKDKLYMVEIKKGQ